MHYLMFYDFEETQLNSLQFLSIKSCHSLKLSDDTLIFVVPLFRETAVKLTQNICPFLLIDCHLLIDLLKLRVND
jgi:hypothetical protein